MTELTGGGPSGRRRRSEARRSIAAIVEAATDVLAQRPNASVEDIAEAAGVTRQTVYAHFSSRERLIDAAVEHLTGQAAAAMDAAGLDQAQPAEALLAFIRCAWQLFGRYPVLLAMSGREGTSDGHAPVSQRLEALITRGQASGTFSSRLPANWLSSAVIALGHAAGQQAILGAMEPQDAEQALEESVLRVVGVAAIS